jgi:DNA-binding transcriptional ArsR family regulator
MVTTNALAEIGSLVGDPGRASMLMALMDGRALTAGELAATAGITPQTASSHLGQLVSAGLVAMERQGRHRYHRLASPAIAGMVEGMMTVAAGGSATAGPRIRTGPKDEAMRHARTCYDHLAGRVAVAVADALLERGAVVLGDDGGVLTPAGSRLLSGIGVALPSVPEGHVAPRAFCRPCLDWSERRPHIAGRVGAALLDHLVAEAWVRKAAGTRAVIVTPLGRRRFAQMFGGEFERRLDQ